MGIAYGEGDVDSNGAEEVNLRDSTGTELLGQKASAASLPVVIASNQSAVPISAASLPLPTGAATTALQTTGNTSLSSIDTKTPTVGQKVMASSTPVVIASDQTALPIAVGLPTYLSSMFGYATGINQPTAGTSNPLVFLKNPSGSGKTISMKFISYGIAVANNLGTIRIYKNPTTSANGTAKTIIPFGGGTTVMQLFEVPTVTDLGTSLLSTYVTGQNQNSLLIPMDFEIRIAANETILVTGNPGSNNRQAEISMRWLEL